MFKTFPIYMISEDNLFEIQKIIEQDMMELGLEKKQVLHASMLLEEISVIMREHGAKAMQVSI